MNIHALETISLSNNAKTIKLCENGLNDLVSSVVYLQVLSNCTIAVTGTTEKDKTATAVGLIDMSDFTIKESITEAGLYMVATDGLYSMTITATGTSDVVIKVVQ